MNVRSVHIGLARKGFLRFSEEADFEGICHVKTLPYLSVVQAVEGEYEIALGNSRRLHTGSGGFFVAPSDVLQTIVHHVDPQSKRIYCRWVFLKVMLNDEIPMDRIFNFPVVIPSERAGEMNGIFERLFSTDDPFEEYSCYYAVASLLNQMATPAVKLTDKLSAALDYIKENYRDRLDVLQLSQQVKLSPSRFHALFKEKLGMSPIGFLNNYRLSKAAQLLLDTSESVSDIAMSVGISDTVYFCRIFKRAYQVSPGRYRRIYGEKR